MAPPPVVDHLRPANAEALRYLGCIDEVVEVDASSHARTVLISCDGGADAY